ncbi:MAG: hypothetical protein K1X77_07990 [Bacteroidia bacterium]|nr:hypothetical protein [Bacteroidia bacterium]
MSKNLNIYTILFSLLMCAFASTEAYAQKRKDTSVVVRDNYIVRIAPDPQKFNESPQIADTGSTKMDIRYDLNSRKIHTAYEIDPIKAASVKNEPLAKLYRGYAKAGFGTYNTPYAELFYNNLRSKKYGAGVHFKHLSSTGQIADVGYSGFNNNQLGLYGKYFIRKSTLSGNIDYQRNGLHYYGFNTNPLDTLLKNYDLNREAIKQHYQLIGVSAGFSDNYPLDSQATKYKGQIKYYNYSDKYESVENNFNLNGKVSFYLKSYAFDIKTALDYYSNTAGKTSSSMTIFNLHPSINFNQERWRLNAGLNTWISGDSSNAFRIVPEVDFDFHIYKDMIILNAGTDSRLYRNSWKNITVSNPFLISQVPLANTWAPMRWYAGLRGSLGARLAFGVKASYVQLTNQVFFVNDTSSGNLNKLTTEYLNPSLVQVDGEISWRNSDRLWLIAKTTYMGYTMDEANQKPWHTPALRLSFSGKYSLRDKIVVTPTILYLGHQFSREFSYQTDSTGKVTPSMYSRKLGGITDINLGIEYKYNKVLGMFVQLNNILNVRYQRFRDYPTQRFNLLAGIGYSF